jgi:hypothetical protein
MTEENEYDSISLLADETDHLFGVVPLLVDGDIPIF